MSENEQPLFVYAIQKVNNNYSTFTENKEIPPQVVVASMRAQLKLLEKEFLEGYKSGTI